MCDPSGRKFSSNKLSTNLCFSPVRPLSRSDKSILIETDWNNGGDYTLNGFLLCCSARLSATLLQKSRENETEKGISNHGTESEARDRVNESKRDT